MKLEIYAQKKKKKKKQKTTIETTSEVYLHIVHVHFHFLQFDLQVQNLSLPALDVVPQKAQFLPAHLHLVLQRFVLLTQCLRPTCMCV